MEGRSLPPNPEVIRHPGLAPVAKGNNSKYPRQEQQLFALSVWSWGRGGARGKAGHVTLASSCDVLGLSTCGKVRKKSWAGR